MINPFALRPECITRDTDDGLLDEIVAYSTNFHLERMDDDAVFFQCWSRGETKVHAYVYVERRWFRRPRLRVRINETTIEESPDAR